MMHSTEQFNYCIVAGDSHVGMHRKANEDHWGQAQTPNGWAVTVCDGMGGHVGGAVASGIAVETILRILTDNYYPDPCQAIAESITAANRAILDRASADPSLQGMGSTCVLLLVREGKVYYGHVGDSRIYLVRDNRIMQLTKDHSYVQTLVDAGTITKEEAEHHPRKNEITNALGLARMLPPTIAEDAINTQAGDCFLLCSDGLSGLVSDDSINRTAIDRSKSLLSRARTLINKANKAGGYDNITVAMAEFAVTYDENGSSYNAQAKARNTPWKPTDRRRRFITGGIALTLLAIAVMMVFCVRSCSSPSPSPSPSDTTAQHNDTLPGMPTVATEAIKETETTKNLGTIYYNDTAPFITINQTNGNLTIGYDSKNSGKTTDNYDFPWDERFNTEEIKGLGVKIENGQHALYLQKQSRPSAYLVTLSSADGKRKLKIMFSLEKKPATKTTQIKISITPKAEGSSIESIDGSIGQKTIPQTPNDTPAAVSDTLKSK